MALEPGLGFLLLNYITQYVIFGEIISALQDLQPISTLSSLLLIIFFLIFYKRNEERKLWVIFGYVVASFAFDIVTLSVVYQPEKQMQRFYLFSVFTIIEYSFFSYFFYLTFQKEAFKKAVVALYILFKVIALASMVLTTDYTFDSVCAPVESILVIMLSIFFFYEQMSSPENGMILTSKSFWIIVAFLIYLSASLFLFVSTSYLSLKEHETFWPIANIANIIKNFLFAVAFIRPPDQALAGSSRQLGKF